MQPSGSTRPVVPGGTAARVQHTAPRSRDVRSSYMAPGCTRPPTARPPNPAEGRTGAQSGSLPARYAVGLTPRSRLKAALSAKPSP